MTRIWSVALVGVLAAPAAAQVPEVTLDEAVRRALQVQPAMVQARGTQRNAAAARRSALGAFLPTVETSWAASYNSQVRIDNTTGLPVPNDYIQTAGLSANLTLFDGLGRFSTYRASRAGQDAADAGLVAQRFEIMLDTKRAFYTALASDALVRVAQAQVRRAEQQLQISVDKLRAGSATRSDSLRAVVEYGNARLSLLRNEASLATAQAHLGRQIGLEVPVRAVVVDTVLPAFPDTTSFRAEAVTNAPAVQQADAAARQYSAETWTSRSQYIPTLRLSYNDNGQGSTWSEFQRTYRWDFRLSWTVFNGFGRETANTAASVRRDNAQAQAAEARRQVYADLTEQVATLANSYTAIDIAQANVAAAEEDLRVQQERYRVGASTILDLLVSQAALTEAERNRVQTIYDYLLARAQVEATIGRQL